MDLNLSQNLSYSVFPELSYTLEFTLDSSNAIVMTRSIFVHLLPTLTTPDQMEGGTAVVIDILRASTTILHALDAGVTAITPLREVDEARRASAFLPRPVLLGGERDGKKIKGFDLDNSPWNYTRDVCDGRHLVFTTTNGTRALKVCCSAETVYLGAFSNLSILTAALLASPNDIHLVCAGTDGEVTLEDVLYAGVVSRRILAEREEIQIGNDSVRLAISLVPSNLDSGSIVELFCVSRGGTNLLDLRFERDLDRAAEIDRIPVLAVWDAAANLISRG